MTLEEKINDWRGEWWHSGNGDTYVELAQRLIRLGVPEDDAVNVLYIAFSAAADEHGG